MDATECQWMPVTMTTDMNELIGFDDLVQSQQRCYRIVDSGQAPAAPVP